MKTVVTIHDAKTNLSKYISAAKKGHKIFIGGFGRPEVMLVQVTPSELAESQVRDFSVAQNKISEMPDSFSPETEQQIQDLLIQ
jgi:prevent-host-death family protein